MSTTDFLLLLSRTVLPLGVLWGWFWLMLRPERCYRFNRWLLLLAPLLAVALPLLPRPALPAWLAGPAAPVTGFAPVLLPAIGPGPAPAVGPALPAWQTHLLVLYGLGVALALGRLAWQLARVRQLRRRFEQAAGPGYTLAYTSGQLPTSSFGGTVFWDDTTALPPAEAAAVLAHEVAHVRQGHTYGLLWLEAWRALLWFNPFAHLLLPSLRLTHELLADAAAAPGPAAPAYSALLARLAVRRLAGPGYFTLLQPFTLSFTLTRIAMLQNQIPVRRWKQWLALPVLGGLFLVACHTTDVRPVSTPSSAALPPSVSVTYRTADKDGRRLALKELVRLDSAQTGGKKPLNAVEHFINAPAMDKSGLTMLTIFYTRVSNGASVATNSKVYLYVEQMPQLPGNPGTGAIVQAIQANVVYPTGRDGKPLPEGRSYVSFIVKADGTVGDIKVIKSVSPACDLAVIDAIDKLPRFEPGRQDGKAVAVSFTVPVTFKL